LTGTGTKTGGVGGADGSSDAENGRKTHLDWVTKKKIVKKKKIGGLEKKKKKRK